jgi:hypothetical protein
MANAIKYSTTGDTQSLKKGNFYFGVGDVGKGPSSATTYYNGVTPVVSGYTVYSYDANQTSKINFASPTTDSEFIKITNDKSGQNFTGVTQCLNWYSTQTNHVSVNKDYEGMVTNGLVLNLDASYTPSYTSSGTTWYDLSYDNNNGTLTNGPTFNSGSGGSIVFDGVDDSVDCGVVPSTIYQTFTVSSWVRCTNVGLNNNIVSKNGPYFMRIVSSKLRFNVLTNTGWLFQVGNVTLSNNVWYNLSMVYDGSTWKGYINSNLDFSVSKTGSITTNSTLYIGYTPAAGEQAGFNGNISQTSIYNRSLTTQEILQNYQSTFTRFLGKNIVTSGLVNYLDAGYNASYPGSGTTWNNISGVSGGTGTLVNGPTYSTNSGGSVVFDGIDDYINLGNLNVGNTISVFGWFNSTTNNGSQNVIVSKLSSGFTTGWELENNNGSLRATLRPSVSNSNNVIGGDIILGNWYYGGFTCDNTTINLYLNSVLTSTSSISSTITLNSSENVLIGRRIQGQYFSGNISNIQIYNRSLTQSEILQNYQAQLPTIVGENFVTNGLVLYLDAGYRTSYPTTGTTWNNVSGVSGGTGTLTNGPTYNSANGGSIVFDGVDDFVQGTISPSTFTGPHTICCWFYREMIKNWSALFSNNVNTTSCSNFTFIESTNYLGTNQIGVNANSISVDLGSDHLNKWIYGVITYGGNSIGSTVNVYAYKDGNLLTASGGLYWNMSSASSFYVGRHYSSEFQIHDGLISNVSVYNRSLTPQEILQNYNATKSRYGL